MSDEQDRYRQALDAALALAPSARLRLIAELASALAEPEPEPTTPAPPATGHRPPAASGLGHYVLVDNPDPARSPRERSFGIEPTSGRPLLELDFQAIRRIASGEPVSKERQGFQRKKRQADADSFGVISGVDPRDLRQARWAVVVNASDSAELITAVMPLIARRCEEMGISAPTLKPKAGETCGAWLARTGADVNAPMLGQSPLPVFLYNRGESVLKWLKRNRNVRPGPVDPTQGIPFYLLLLGRPGEPTAADPAYIPFEFQYDLDLFWGVGRLCFTDHQGQHDFAGYRAYAERAAAFEGGAVPYGRSVSYFATRNNDLDETALSDAGLVSPLLKWQQETHPGFKSELVRAEAATTNGLARTFSGAGAHGRPAVLFTASHGMGLLPNAPNLPAHQGALVCQEWSGEGTSSRAQWFTGDDLDALGGELRVDGMIAVLFACYSVGCPRRYSYSFEPGAEPAPIAPRDLVARLPQRMLANGALAVLGHVDLAWAASFSRPGTRQGGQIQAFQDVMGELLKGERAGFATDKLNLQSALHAATLAQTLPKVIDLPDPLAGAADVAHLWLPYQDARAYMLLGDPAVRLHPL